MMEIMYLISGISIGLIIGYTIGISVQYKYYNKIIEKLMNQIERLVNICESKHHPSKKTDKPEDMNYGKKE